MLTRGKEIHLSRWISSTCVKESVMFIAKKHDDFLASVENDARLRGVFSICA